MADTTQENAPDMSQVNPQALAAIAQLIQASQQNQQTQQPPMSTPSGTNQAGSQMLAGQGPYQKGASKALQAAGEQHVQQALQAGMAPDQIQNHGIMTGQQDPNQVLQSILPPQNPVQSPGYNPQTGNIQEGGVLNRMLRGFAGGGIPGLLGGIAGPNATQQMEGLKTAQVLKSGQPSDIALPQAEAQESKGRAAQAQAEAQYTGALGKQVQQELKGLTPKQAADINVQLIQNKREADNQYMQRLQDTLKGAQDFQDLLTKNTNFVGRGDKMKENESYMKILRATIAKKTLGNVSQGNNVVSQSIKDKYNQLRASGISMEEAKKQAGI